MTYDEHYAECIANGCSPALANILASRTAPGLKTDTTFMEGRLNGSQFDDPNLVAALRLNGATSFEGKAYISGMARFPGDPQALVESRAEVKAFAEKHNVAIEGAVSHSPHNNDAPPEKVELNPVIVERRLEQLSHQNPELKKEWKEPKKLAKAKAEMYERLKPPKD